MSAHMSLHFRRGLARHNLGNKPCVHALVYTYAHAHVCTHLYTHAYAHICTHAYTHAYAHADTFA